MGKTDWSKYEAYSMVMKKKVCYSGYGDTPLGRAMVKALAAVDARVGAGKMSAANAAGYKGRIDGLKPLIGNDEPTGLLQVSQMIGAINRSV
ncbi:MAG: hypothetical protein FWH44_01955 [Methanomassiliicoccaceae archaeon]|nr:hypothetical protein [Methanomassiliicoccaceae archaeon]